MEIHICRHAKYHAQIRITLILIMQKAYSAGKIFNGNDWITEQAIVVNSGAIEDILPLSQLPSSIPCTHYKQHRIIPAFVDAQVYGAAGKLFSLYSDKSTLQAMHRQFLWEGTCCFQPTIATNTIEVFKQCIDAVRSYWAEGGQGVIGLHLEGPWLNPEKRGAHIKELIHAPTIEEVKDLLDYGKGVITMITVAPEMISQELIDLILGYNIILSAGHSNASYAQAMEKFNAGITTVTHLYNAMSPLHHREPGLVGAAMQHESIMSSIIPDGYHVDFAAIAIAKKVMQHRLFAITDAVTETSKGPYQHYRTGEKYECNGTLSGSAISMFTAFQNLVKKSGIEEDEALRMCSLYPSMALKIDGKYGKIAPGYAAQFIVIDNDLNLVQVLTVQDL
jgi:N-acetylglucosamine-6-phosphate deacetylase